MAKTAFTSVDDYLAAQPPPIRAVLRQVRAAIHKALPGATEGISYQMPIFKLGGAMVLYIAGYAKHWSIYPATPHVIDALADQLADHVHHKATIRFGYDRKVPVRLVAQIARLRADEVGAKHTAKRKPAKPAKRKPAKRK